MLTKHGDYVGAVPDPLKAIRLHPNHPNAIKKLTWLQGACAALNRGARQTWSALTFLVFAGALSSPQTVRAELSMTADRELVELSNDSQKLAFSRDRNGQFRLSTFVRRDGAWSPFFDGETPLVQGAEFDLFPTECKVVENSASRVAVELSGAQARQGYAWDMVVEMTRPTELAHFRLTCRLRQPMVISGLGPQLAFWMNKPDELVAVNQGPGNIYHGAADIEWGNSFPAAYLWTSGKEAAIFFNMTSMTWMSHRNLFRFRDCRVQAFHAAQRTGFGLRVVKRNFHEVPAGDMVFDFYLHAAALAERPTKRESVGRVVDLFAPLHPTTAAWPENRLAADRARWATFARGVADNLMLADVVWQDLALPKEKPWRDGPAFVERTVPVLRVSSDYAVNSACQPQWNRKSVGQAWDFSTCNNYLAAWIAYERLHPDPEQHRHLALKVSDIPLFFDPDSKLIRHSTRYPARVGNWEMTWQNLTFGLETTKVFKVQAAADYDPASAGKFLTSLATWANFAHKVEYIFPQWFDPIRLVGVSQQDVPELGVVREPWQVGLYAYLMCEGFEITENDAFLDEAKRSIERLLDGQMRYVIDNQRYRIEYDDVVDFPITEIFGNAWGVAAAETIHARTGDPAFRRYSDDFLNSLLRMTYWYESELRDDPKDQVVRSAGLFRNHSGAYTGSPWETSEAFLALTVRLRHETKPRLPLLALFNLYRINSFFFFPAVWPDAAACPQLQNHAANYLPIEDYYTHEHGGENGGMGRAVYMSGLAFWNYLMFEAFAEANDPNVMVLNLDAVEAFDMACQAARREFFVYNPTSRIKSVKISMKQLPEGRYRVQQTSVGQQEHGIRTFAASELQDGLLMELPPLGDQRVVIERDDNGRLRKSIEIEQQARRRLAYAYQLLQQAAGRKIDERFERSKASYLQALADYRQANFSTAEHGASEVVDNFTDL